MRELNLHLVPGRGGAVKANGGTFTLSAVGSHLHGRQRTASEIVTIPPHGQKPREVSPSYVLVFDGWGKTQFVRLKVLLTLSSSVVTFNDVRK